MLMVHIGQLDLPVDLSHIQSSGRLWLDNIAVVECMQGCTFLHNLWMLHCFEMVHLLFVIPVAVGMQALSAPEALFPSMSCVASTRNPSAL